MSRLRSAPEYGFAMALHRQPFALPCSILRAEDPMLQLVQLDTVRRRKAERSIESVDCEIRRTRQVLQETIDRLGRLEDSREFLERRLREVELRREVDAGL